MPRLNRQELVALARTALERAGVRASAAQATADALVLADMQGLATHGVSRVPMYVGMIRQGRADPAAECKVLAHHGAVCLVDAQEQVTGYEACALGVREAVERAKKLGVGFAGVTNSSHCGVVANNLLPIAAAGLVGIGFSNAPAAIPAWGGKRGFFGTNPIAAVFPRREADPIIVDLSLTTVVRGTIMLAAERGESIPEGWALGPDGKPTTDPKAALVGSLFPVGGAKGAMLALVVELLVTTLTGAAFGFEADSFFKENGNTPRIGQAFLAIDPGSLAGRGVYFSRVETLVTAMLADPDVRMPGERRHRAFAEATAHGIEVPDDLLNKLRALAQA